MIRVRSRKTMSMLSYQLPALEGYHKYEHGQHSVLCPKTACRTPIVCDAFERHIKALAPWMRSVDVLRWENKAVQVDEESLEGRQGLATDGGDYVEAWEGCELGIPATEVASAVGDCLRDVELLVHVQARSRNCIRVICIACR